MIVKRFVENGAVQHGVEKLAILTGEAHSNPTSVFAVGHPHRSG